MPTGYTAYIEDGNITTGKDFLTLCCRNFGVCADMREDSLSKPIPEKIEPDTYYKQRYEDALIELERAKSLTNEAAINRIKLDRKNREESIVEHIKKNEEIKVKYLKIRNEVEKWVPPTSEHVGLKKFALEQIDMCVHDYTDYYNKELERIHIEIMPEDYIKDNIAACEAAAQRAKANYEAEIQRTNERNMWLQSFRDSFQIPR